MLLFIKLYSTIYWVVFTATWLSLIVEPAFGFDEERIAQICKSKLDFKSIEEFYTFVTEYKQLKDFKGKNKHLNNCLDQRESILALEELIKNYDRKRPCKFDQVTKLEDYAKKHLNPHNKAKPIVLKLFTLFGVNIGFVCKLNLLAHIKQAELEVEQLDFIYSMASPTGWNILINEHTKKSMKFGVSSQANNVVNRVSKLVPGLKLIEHLTYMDFDHSMSENRIDPWQGVEVGFFKLENIESTIKISDNLVRIIESCQNLEQFFYNLTLSLAKLNHLGLVVEFDLNKFHEDNIILHKWLAATSFCQLMTRVKISTQKGDEIHFELIHRDDLLDNRRKVYSYEAEFDDIRPEVVDKAWLASVMEGQWLQKSAALFLANRKGGKVSLAMDQVIQFIKGLQVDHKSALQ